MAFLISFDDDVGMAVGDGEYQGFAGQARVDVLRQLLRDCTRLNSWVMTPPVEAIDFEPDFIGRVHEVDLTGARIEDFELLVSLEGDAGAAERGFDANRRLVID